MWEAVKWVLTLYYPPPPGDADRMFRYQMALSTGVVGIWFVVWLAGIWLIGKAPFVPQVAWANQVEDVSQKLDDVKKDTARNNSRVWSKLTEMQVLQLRASIEQQVKNVCFAQRAKNQNDLDNANAQLSQLTDSYLQMAGRPFAVPSCSTILVDGP